MLMVPVNITLGRMYKFPNGMHVINKGVKIYTKDGDKHRLNGPAEIHPDGLKIWYSKGIKHRIGGPAVVKPDGTEEYWENGKLIKTL